VRFLVDMPLSPTLAAWLRQQGHDATHATELGLERAPDAEVLARAKQGGRTVVTVDLDYPRLLALTEATAPSLILFRDGIWSEAEIVARMREVLAALAATDIEQSIVVVERDRIRRRKLPIED
jgi:predicted nuclease of predicted toxin-antitoxin system